MCKNPSITVVSTLLLLLTVIIYTHPSLEFVANHSNILFPQCGWWDLSIPVRVLWHCKQQRESTLQEAFPYSLHNRKQFVFQFQLVILGPNVEDQTVHSSALLLQTAFLHGQSSAQIGQSQSWEGRGLKSTSKDHCRIAKSAVLFRGNHRRGKGNVE